MHLDYDHWGKWEDNTPDPQPAQLTQDRAFDLLNTHRGVHGLSQFIPKHDDMLSPTLVGEWLMNNHDCEEELAFEYAYLWVNEVESEEE